MNLMFDQKWNEKRFWPLKIQVDFNHENLSIKIDSSLPATWAQVRTKL